MSRSENPKASQPKQIRTIGDLEQYMTAHQLSAEAMARKVLLSNMTIRRMLRRKSSEKISKKYWPIFDQLFADTADVTEPQLFQLSTDLFSDFDSLKQDLEKAGLEQQNVDQLTDDVYSKMESENIGQGLKASLKTLLGAVTGSKTSVKSRAIALGALLYFMNPIDLIPDALVGVGYLDDFAVACVAISAIANNTKTGQRDKKKLAKR